MNKGFSLIEVIVSVAIVAILCISFTALTLQALKVSRINANELKARMYVQELMEVAIDLEQSGDEGWTKLSEYTVCHPFIDGGKWQLSVGPETIDIYTRSLLVESIDPNKKKVTASISWPDKSLTIESYVYNYAEE